MPARGRVKPPQSGSYAKYWVCEIRPSGIRIAVTSKASATSRKITHVRKRLSALQWVAKYLKGLAQWPGRRGKWIGRGRRTIEGPMKQNFGLVALPALRFDWKPRSIR